MNCIICKAEFKGRNKAQILCGSKDCKNKRRQILKKERERKKERENPKVKKKKIVAQNHKKDLNNKIVEQEHTEYDIRVDNNIKKLRPCLKCDILFLSEGIGNRICPSCKKNKIFSSSTTVYDTATKINFGE